MFCFSFFFFQILDVSGCEKITDELIYNTINILKEGDRKNVLELVVGATQIQNQIIEEERVTQSAALLKISFENNYESHIFHSDNIFGSLLDNTDFDICEYDYGRVEVEEMMNLTLFFLLQLKTYTQHLILMMIGCKF